MACILIRGVRKPNDCGKCFVGDRTICADGCPIDELQPHGDLIERNPLVKLFNSRETDEHWGWLDEEDLRNAPVIVPSNKEASQT